MKTGLVRGQSRFFVTVCAPSKDKSEDSQCGNGFFFVTADDLRKNGEG